MRERYRTAVSRTLAAIRPVRRWLGKMALMVVLAPPSLLRSGGNVWRWGTLRLGTAARRYGREVSLRWRYRLRFHQVTRPMAERYGQLRRRRK